MAPSRILCKSVAAAAALVAGLALAPAGPAAAKPSDGCDSVTGELIDHGTTVTAKFHVATTCAKVSVLSWYAAGPHGEYPQDFLDRIGEENVAPGDYEWTIEAPPAECFRQLDLRVPNRNVDSIVGGDHECSTTSTTVTPTTTPTNTPTSTPTSTPSSAPFTPTTIAGGASTTTPNPNSVNANSPTTTLQVAGVAITSGAPAELPRTGMALGDLLGIGLAGTALGAFTLVAASRRRSARRAAGPR